MTRKSITALTLGLALAIVLLWDLWVAVHGDWQATTSYVVYNVAKGNPIIPFLVGVAMGHLFWPVKAEAP